MGRGSGESLASERRRISGCRFSLSGLEKGQSEIRLPLQAGHSWVVGPVSRWLRAR